MKELLKMLEESKNLGDVDYYTYENELNIDFNDFDGFDDEWNEVEREYTNENLVNKILNYIETNATLIKDSLYQTYQLDDKTIVIGYTSFDVQSNEVDKNKLAPMMKHYVDLKEKYQDVILFYSLGDF